VVSGRARTSSGLSEGRLRAVGVDSVLLNIFRLAGECVFGGCYVHADGRKDGIVLRLGGANQRGFCGLRRHDELVAR